MVFTRSQRESMSREQLTKELLNLSDISIELSNLTEKFHESVSKFDKLHPELQLPRNYTSHLMQQVIGLEKNAVTN